MEISNSIQSCPLIAFGATCYFIISSFLSEGAEWFITLEPISVGERCSITVSEDSIVFEDSILSESIILSEAESSILLEDVLFGDVWFCSGQVMADLNF